jgi:hypothetical protein
MVEGQFVIPNFWKAKIGNKPNRGAIEFIIAPVVRRVDQF